MFESPFELDTELDAEDEALFVDLLAALALLRGVLPAAWVGGVGRGRAFLGVAGC